MGSAQIVIIGAGFAGASTAYYLTRLGLHDILILEQEDFPGVHASGRNAGMIRQIVSDDAVASLLREGAGFIRNLAGIWPTPVEFHQTGSLLLGAGTVWKGLMADAEKAQKAGIPVEYLSTQGAIREVPALEDGDFEGAIGCPTDGVVDIHGLLYGYLQLAQAGGARLLTATKVLALQTMKGRITTVVTESETIQTEVVVNAAGAWATEIARMAGAAALPLSPYRRHLFATDVLSWVRPDWPFVWDLADEFYFRPESGGLLLSPCDEVLHPPGLPLPYASAGLLLYEKLKRYPRLCNLTVKTSWAGLRTLSPDRRFVIGWDPTIHGFFWVAGLGGHGVTASGAVGRLAADLIINPNKEGVKHVSPARFTQQ